MNTVCPLVGLAARPAWPPQPGLAAAGPKAHRSHPRDAIETVEVAPQNAPAVSEAARVAEIRAEIARGEYLTEHKLNVVIERLHAALTAPRAPSGSGAAT